MSAGQGCQRLQSPRNGQWFVATDPVQVWHKSLTPREREVARLLRRNFPNGEIARKLGIKLSTVKTHVRNIFTKLDTEFGARRRWSKGASTAAGRERIREAQRHRWQRWRAARSDDNT
jgi:DNA-binding NarL/FixJ family response regulator